MSLDVEVLRCANAAVVTPGDTILIAFKRSMTLQEIDEVKDFLRQEIPEGVKIVFVDQVESVTAVKP